MPEAEKAIYLDDDIIVQGKAVIQHFYSQLSLPLECFTHWFCFWTTGDIQELYDTKLKPGHAAAFSNDCDSASAKGIIRGAGHQVGINCTSYF